MVTKKKVNAIYVATKWGC